MDDIQFWIYVIFAIIYFIAKNYGKSKKKSGPDTPDPDRPQTAARPRSFEDLLEEITGNRTLEEAEDGGQDEDERYLQPKPWEQKQVDPSVEEKKSKTLERRFADDESRRIYEESIKMAEGSDIDYTREGHPEIKRLKSTASLEPDTPSPADEIRDMLADTDSAKKAIILGEILNRKY